MKKILILCLSALLLLSLFTVVASAAEVSEEAEVSESIADVLPEEGEDTPPAVAAVADFLRANADTILGILTLVGSLLVAFFYKMGLLPTLRAGINALGDLLGKNREVTEQFTKDAGETFVRIEQQTAPVLAIARHSEALLTDMEGRLAALEKELAAAEKERKDTAAVLRTETELFYELLHSVNLPEAQKESMTESYYRLKRQLEAEV